MWSSSDPRRQTCSVSLPAPSLCARPCGIASHPQSDRSPPVILSCPFQTQLQSAAARGVDISSAETICE
jgi:hypothetical protein